MKRPARADLDVLICGIRQFFFEKPYRGFPDLGAEPESMGIYPASTSSSAMKIKLFSGPSTRRWPRFDIDAVPALNGVCSGSGSEMRLSNISCGGALLKTRERLMPGAKIRFRFVVSGEEIRLAGFVLRSSPAVPRTLPRFQTAVVFDRPFQIPEDRPAAGTCASQALRIEPSSLAGISPVVAGPGLRYAAGPADALSAIILSYRICNTPSRLLCEMFGMNSW